MNSRSTFLFTVDDCTPPKVAAAPPAPPHPRGPVVEPPPHAAIATVANNAPAITLPAIVIKVMISLATAGEDVRHAQIELTRQQPGQRIELLGGDLELVAQQALRLGDDRLARAREPARHRRPD